jgi:amino acid transporter
MTKKLERDLRLVEVIAISIGAMIGSGIFILPALAMELAGPSVIVAYFLSALLVLPAALSKAEMATAMPEAGGTYIYIERGMGPLLGTVAGIGTWFSLTFKSGLALVGGVPYIVLMLDVPVKLLAIAIAVGLLALNIFGTKQTGQFQTWLVVMMLGALVWFVFGSLPDVRSEHFHEFYRKGPMGVLKATGLVFVSYAGVTKIASVAEEVENPERNIPIGILGSLIFTAALYVLLVIIMVGVSPSDVLADSVTPMADAAEVGLGYYGTVAVILAAVLALVSTANAGILSASRYPLAMARDQLFPNSLETISTRFGTPTKAISVTGSVLLVLIAFVPILEIAKLASAFTILVFIFVNMALIAFREGRREYKPEFRSPLYPWTQVFGIFGGIILLPQMGFIPFAGAIAITAGSVLWYIYWGRKMSDREGVATESIRQRVGEKIVEETKNNIKSVGKAHTLVGLRESIPSDRKRHLLELSQAIISVEDCGLDIMQFEQVVDQIPLGVAAETVLPSDRNFEQEMGRASEGLDIDMKCGEVVAHNIKSALVNYVDRNDIEIVLLPEARKMDPRFLPQKDIEWILRNAKADVLLANTGPLQRLERVCIFTRLGTYEPSAITVADSIAHYLDLNLVLVDSAYPTDATAKRDSIKAYHEILKKSCKSNVQSKLLEISNPQTVKEAFHSDDLAIISLTPGAIKYMFWPRPERRLIKQLPCDTIQFRPRVPRQLTRIERILDRRVF